MELEVFQLPLEAGWEANVVAVQPCDQIGPRHFQAMIERLDKRPAMGVEEVTNPRIGVLAKKILGR